LVIAVNHVCCITVSIDTDGLEQGVTDRKLVIGKFMSAS